MMDCPKCGNPDLLEMTEFNRARCHIQYLIDYSTFCYDCQPDCVKEILDNPNKTCEDCKFISPVCPAGYGF